MLLSRLSPLLFLHIALGLTAVPPIRIGPGQASNQLSPRYPLSHIPPRFPQVSHSPQPQHQLHHQYSNHPLSRSQYSNDTHLQRPQPGCPPPPQWCLSLPHGGTVLHNRPHHLRPWRRPRSGWLRSTLLWTSQHRYRKYDTRSHKIDVRSCE